MRKANTRDLLIAGNWKMNHSAREVREFFNAPLIGFDETLRNGKLKVVLIPPFLVLQEALGLVSNRSLPISIAAQNAHWEKSGAFTGEVSGPQLTEIGISWALVGHSERRQYFGETDETVKKRCESLLKQGFTVIFCLGENQSEREKNEMEKILTRQLKKGLPSLDILSNHAGKLILAYEPIWAIGTGVNATPDQAEEAHRFLRTNLANIVSPEFAEKTLLLYGGSVNSKNMDSLLNCENVDGALVGGASLKPESFFELVQIAKSQFQP